MKYKILLLSGDDIFRTVATMYDIDNVLYFIDSFKKYGCDHSCLYIDVLDDTEIYSFDDFVVKNTSQLK